MAGIAGNTQDDEGFPSKGGERLASKGVDGVIAELTRAIRDNPRNALAHRQRGAAFAKKADFDRAIADFNEALRLNPKDISARYFRGLAWQRKRNFRQALIDYDAVLQTDPNHSKALINRKLALAIQQGRVPGHAAIDQDKRRYLKLFSRLPEDHKLKSKTLHPARRFFARYIDWIFASLVLNIVGDVFDHAFSTHFFDVNILVFPILVGLVLIPLESAQLSLFGSTLGKSVYGITVVPNVGTRLSFGQSALRSFKVYTAGAGLCIPIVWLYFVNRGYRHLLVFGQTGWDISSGTHVTHTPPSTLRRLLLVLTWVIALGIVVLERSSANLNAG